MKNTIIAIIFLTLPACLVAQTKKHTIIKKEIIQPLAQGQAIPDVSLNFSNGSKKSLAQLSKGKLLIIDFFATWCGSCIKVLPHLDSLQKEFKDKVLILPCSYESNAVINGFLARRKSSGAISLPFVTNDIRLQAMFPHHLLPHEIWIDQEGKYIFSTGPEAITRETINRILKKDTSGVDKKIDDNTYSNNKLLLVDGNGGKDDSFFARSICTAFKPGIASSAKIIHDDNGNVSRIICTNIDAMHLFTQAYSKFIIGFPNSKRTIFNGSDSTQLLRMKKPLREWQINHCYCYELILPHLVPQELFYSYMLEDLNRYFDVKASVEQKKIPCWELVRISNDDKLLATKGGEEAYAHMGKIRNSGLSSLLNYLQGYKDIEPIIDKTGFTGRVDMDLEFVHNLGDRNKYPDVDVIKKNLNRYGLDLRKAENETGVLVISPKSSIK